MSILYFSPGTTSSSTDDQILNGLREHLPNHSIFVYPDCPDYSSITTAIVWQAPPEFFNELVNLKHILSMAAGVDHLFNHAGLPDNVDIVRLADAGMAEPMAQYILYGVLHAQRNMVALAQAQREKQWRHDIKPMDAHSFHVGILGAGELSLVAAERLVNNGYTVSCWSRSPKQLDNIKHYTGTDGLNELLPQINVLVCLLPLTSETNGILNTPLLNKLQKGAFLINPGRGGHADEDAILKALNSAQLSGALLDVFSEEPLPSTHPMWSHPNIIVTPHVAAPTPAVGAVRQLVESLVLLESNQKPRGLVDRDAGY